MKRGNRLIVAVLSAAFTFSILAVTVGTDNIGQRHHWHHGHHWHHHHDCDDAQDQDKSAKESQNDSASES